MAPGTGAGPDDLSHLDQLAAQPTEYHIFLALRMIEAQFQDAPRLGESRRPREEKLRIAQEPSLIHAPTTLTRFEPVTGARPGRLVNLFFGLFGPHGPLPPHLTEYARDRQRSYGDPTFAAFADMLTHRVCTLLFRAWATGQPAVAFDRGDGTAMERKVAALGGYYGAGLRGRDALPDMAKRYFTGHLSAGPKSAAGLESMLSAFFRAPVRIKQFVGSWLELEPSDRWRLGDGAGLGQATSIGSRVWSRSAKFRVRVGPLTLEEYNALLPGGAALSRLRAIVRNYVGDILDWDVNLVLRGTEVPEARLDGTTRLGQTSWIGHRDPARDADDVYLMPMETAAGGARPR
ncbi:MAG: type VI secretion system baseplate subunit TssG [Marinibacterium sp.]